MDSLSADIWSMILGLNLAWDKGLRCICLEMDSVKASKLFRDSCAMDSSLALLCRQIKDLKDRDWQIKISWCYREANEAANWFAREALGQASGLRVFEEAPEALKHILGSDLGPISRTRWVPCWC